MPSSRAARMTRTAISPRLAIRIFFSTGRNTVRMDTPSATPPLDAGVSWPPGWSVSVVEETGSTNADLLQKVKDGIFRQDLYFRLKVVTIELPPLRERRSDIKLLIDHFLGHFCKLHGKDVESIDRDALVALVQYDWPGNVRELRNAVESMVVRAKGNILTRADLPPEIWAPLPVDQDGWQFLAGRTWGEVERNHIRVSLELTSGNRQKAARAMGLSERTLYRKIKALQAATPPQV